MSTKLQVRPEEIAAGAGIGALTGYVSAFVLLLAAGPVRGGWSFFEHAIFQPEASAWHRGAHAVLWAAGLIGAGFGGCLASRQDAEQHVSGIRYIAKHEAAARALMAIERPRMSKAQRAGQRHGLTIAGVELSRSRETEHMLVLGLPGAGKTAAVMLPVIDQVLGRLGSRLLAHDSKGDFTTIYFDPRSAVLLGPWDARSAIWDAAADIDSPALSDEFAASICGVADAGQNAHFHRGAATLLGGLIRARIASGSGWTWSEIAADLASDPIAMIEKAAAGDPLVQSAFPSAFAPARGGQIELTKAERDVISTLANASRLIMQLAAVDSGRPDAMRFSLRHWIARTAHTEIRLAILNNSALYANAAREIFGAMLAVVTASVSTALPPEKSSDDDDAIFVIIDEAKQLGAGGMGAVTTLEEVGRSRGVRVIVALQDQSQLAALVGAEKAAPMLAMQAVRVYLRSSPESSTQIIESLGRREIRRLTSTPDGGALHGKSSSTDTGLAVMSASDIAGLHVTKLRDNTADIEMLIGLQDVVGRVVANSGPRRREIAAHASPCPAWSRGTLPAPAPAPAPAPDQAQTLTQSDPSMDPDVLDDLWSERDAARDAGLELESRK